MVNRLGFYNQSGITYLKICRYFSVKTEKNLYKFNPAKI
jgi:hypothetical protein